MTTRSGFDGDPPPSDDGRRRFESGQPGGFMRIALAYQRGMDRFSEWLGQASAFFVLAAVGVGFVNVVLRYVGELMNRKLTSNMFIEMQWYLYSMVFLLGFAYILKHQINVRVDFWFANQPKKRKATIDLVGHLLALIPFAIMGIWVSWSPVVRSWQIWEQSPDPSGLPRAPIKAMVIVGFVTLLLQGLAELVKLVAVLREHDDWVEIEERAAPLRIE